MNSIRKAWLLSVSLGTLTAALFGVSGALWLSSTPLNEMSARVVEVGPGLRDKNSCGPKSHPLYCNKVQYYTLFEVNGANFKFSERIDRQLTEGQSTVVYRLGAEDSFRYSANPPRESRHYILLGGFSLMVGVLSFGFALNRLSKSPDADGSEKSTLHGNQSKIGS